jgi:hypothetical protein
MKAFLFSIIVIFAVSCTTKPTPLSLTDVPISIPTKGNSWIEGIDSREDRLVLQNGLSEWTALGKTARTYFYVGKIGTLNIGILAKSNAGNGELAVKFGSNSQTIKVTNSTMELVSIGSFEITATGYHYLETELINDAEVDIENVLIGGEATTGKNYYAKEDFYWGRRGPSVHLSYQVPAAASDVVYFYNEINVPEGQDVLGSYFMANGFAEGYFGMQVNRADERRILFSVWSPYKTDNPEDIPADQRIKMLKKGADVHTGEFGNEGSGGQSYWKYMWKAGNNYRFLLKGKPAGNNSTDYTAYFYAPEIGEWELIASFNRPKTDTYLKRPHSFLENFHTETGDQTRKGLYTNQWVYDTNGKWHEMTRAKFTADATAKKESRMDYAGGAEGTNFFMKNCGFFTGWTEIDIFINREALGKAPQIDFSILP